jgi:hypothetical protein
VVDEIVSAGGQASAVQANVVKQAEVERLFAKTQQELSKAISANRLKRESRWVALDSQRISHLPLSSEAPPMPLGLPAKCCTLQVVLVDLFV